MVPKGGTTLDGTKNAASYLEIKDSENEPKPALLN